MFFPRGFLPTFFLFLILNVENFVVVEAKKDFHLLKYLIGNIDGTSD
jgi:hypothetical protein